MCQNQGTDFTGGEALITLLSEVYIICSPTRSLKSDTLMSLLKRPKIRLTSALLAAQVDIAVSILYLIHLKLV